MTAPTPRQFERIIDEVLSPHMAARHRRALLEAYRWVHGAAHDRTVQEQAKIRSTNPSTPTESIAASKAYMRRQLEQTVKTVEHARGDFEEAIRRLIQVLDTLDPPERPDPPRFERSASNADLEESHAARERRHERDEAIP